MRFWTFAPLFAATVAAAAGASATRSAAADPPPTRISGPHIHENLAVYFVHGKSAAGPVPLTLQEAVAKGTVLLVETGRVSELQIENAGTEEVFIQAGDLVKGGRQDRVLTVSFLLPPKSGRVPIASFCVEQGRWSARGREDASKFSSSNEAMPSRAALLAMAMPPPPAAASPPPVGVGGLLPPTASIRAQEPGDATSKQRKVWDSVANTQGKLSRELNTGVAAAESATSLQLSLENAKLKEARNAYLMAIKAEGEKEGDVIGYVMAINGKMNSASIYPSNGLFRKMWEKQLAASVTEAIGEKPAAGKPAPAPAAPAASEFLAAAEKGKAQERAIAADMRQETRDADVGLFNETRRANGASVHKSYLAK